ncbi:MAG TPA: uroporphyrinogen decarboxylase family protein, partial [Anaeromyxobacteraceae bacterium]|nr:uroporphyrinogen decarboxylase family protein [Anaeromyxobacteraceae bacterium]
MAEPSHAFLRACRRLPVERIPAWMMRQAGRYQESYRRVREKVGFLELCRSPELVAQVTAAPIDEFGFDAAILFSDILIHLPAMGLDLSFEKGEKGKGDGGPRIGNPVRTRADVDALRIPDPDRDLRFVQEA